MRLPDLEYTWISRNFRIQNIDGTLVPTADMTKLKRNNRLKYFKQKLPYISVGNTNFPQGLRKVCIANRNKGQFCLKYSSPLFHNITHNK